VSDRKPRTADLEAFFLRKGADPAFAKRMAEEWPPDWARRRRRSPATLPRRTMRTFGRLALLWIAAVVGMALVGVPVGGRSGTISDLFTGEHHAWDWLAGLVGAGFPIAIGLSLVDWWRRRRAQRAAQRVTTAPGA
jgi:hypothetical protein